MDLKNICTQTVNLAIETGKFIRNEKGKISLEKIEVKGLHDFVTYVDKSSEEQLVNGLTKILPGAGFITEEGTSTIKGDKYNWVIDPLDGTTNFIHGLYPFAISIALMEGNEVIAGVVYEIGFDECFYAWKNSKAYLNGQIIEVSATDQVKNSLIATGFPYHDFSKIGLFLNSMEHFMRNSRGVRRLGSAATDLVYVACGRFDAFYEYCLNPWDVAAGAFIVQQAGGVVSDFSGGNDYIFGKEIIAANFNMFNEFQQDVFKHLSK